MSKTGTSPLAIACRATQETLTLGADGSLSSTKHPSDSAAPAAATLSFVEEDVLGATAVHSSNSFSVRVLLGGHKRRYGLCCAKASQRELVFTETRCVDIAMPSALAASSAALALRARFCPCNGAVVLAVVNPAAGGGAGLVVYQEIAPLLEAGGAVVSVLHTQRAGDATAAGRLYSRQILGLETPQKAPPYAILIVGGDGTAAEFVQGAMIECASISRRPAKAAAAHCSSRAAVARVLSLLRLAIVPCGTQNALARGLHTLSPVSAAACILKDRTVPLDALAVTNGAGELRLALCGVAWGIAGAIARDSERWRWAGRSRYAALKLLHGFAVALGLSRYSATVTWEQAPTAVAAAAAACSDGGSVTPASSPILAGATLPSSLHMHSSVSAPISPTADSPSALARRPPADGLSDSDASASPRASRAAAGAINLETAGEASARSGHANSSSPLSAAGAAPAARHQAVSPLQGPLNGAATIPDYSLGSGVLSHGQLDDAQRGNSGGGCGIALVVGDAAAAAHVQLYVHCDAASLSRLHALLVSNGASLFGAAPEEEGEEGDTPPVGASGIGVGVCAYSSQVGLAPSDHSPLDSTEGGKAAAHAAPPVSPASAPGGWVSSLAHATRGHAAPVTASASRTGLARPLLTPPGGGFTGQPSATSPPSLESPRHAPRRGSGAAVGGPGRSGGGSAPARPPGGSERSRSTSGNVVAVGFVSISPDARFSHPSDGTVDVVVARRGGFLASVALMLRYVGRQMGAPTDERHSALLSYEKASRATLQPHVGMAHKPCNIDGEAWAPGPFSIEVLPSLFAAFGVRTPPLPMT